VDIIEFKPGEIVLGNYKIIKEINKGGMGSTIYLADDLNINERSFHAIKNKKVAIKLINRPEEFDDQDWSRISHEFIIASRVTNLKNTIKTFERAIFKNENGKIIPADDGNVIVIVMEYVDGMSLNKYISQQGHLSLNESIYIIRKIVEIINELHSMKRKIIHRDLKPENILVSKDLVEVKLIDYGISSVKNNNSFVTNEESIYGTYPYLPPIIQSVIETKDMDERSKLIDVQFDIYPIGVIFFEMLTGEKPFWAEDYESTDVFKLPMTYDVPPLSEYNDTIPKCVDNIIFRCLASKKEDKKYQYTNTQDLLNDINNIKKDRNDPNIQLLKPKSLRNLQIKNIFNLSKEKAKEKYYVQPWFVVTLSLSGLVLTGIVFVLIMLLFGVI